MQRGESKLRVEAVRVAGTHHPALDFLQIRVRHDDFHEPFRQTAPAIFFHDKHVTQVGERHEIGQYLRKTDLLLPVVEAKIKGGMVDLLLHLRPRNALAQYESREMKS